MPEPIGRVDTVVGRATATRADGSAVTLAVGDPIYQGDAIATGVGGALAIVFVDGTSFALGADAGMVIDAFVFDPTGDADSAAFNLVEGVFVFVSGEVAHASPEAMTLTTPVATIGIRGTTLALKVGGEGEENLYGLLPDRGNRIGEVTVTTDAGAVVLDDAYEATVIASRFDTPARPFVLPRGKFESLFGSLLQTLIVEPDGNLLVTGDGAPTPDAPIGLADDNADQGATPTAEQEIHATIAVLLGDAAVLSIDVLPAPQGFGIGSSMASLLAFVELATGATMIAIRTANDDDIVLLNFNVEGLVLGSGGDDRHLAGGGLNDGIFGFGGNDTIFGLGGDDTIFGGAGNDVIDGGDGDDIRITGDSGDDVISGGAGNDFLQGATGDDRLFGGDGEDLLRGGAGSDRIDGGPGFDTVDFFDVVVGNAQPVRVDLAAGTAANDGQGGVDTLIGIERVIGSNFDDDIRGDGGPNVLVGQEGDDVLLGRGGDDVLSEDFGEEGDDTMDGGAGNDTMNGGEGNDLLVGGGGDDSMSGGIGSADLFVFLSPTDGIFVAVNGTAPAAGDVIADFDPAAVFGGLADRLHFAASAFDPSSTLGLGTLSDGVTFSTIAGSFDGTSAGTNTAFGAGQPTFIFAAADQTLYYDANGVADGYTIVARVLSDFGQPTADDIEIVVR